MSKPITDTKIKSNFHTHTLFSDGNAEPEAYVTKAIELEFTALGFSEHQPVFYETDWTMTPKAVPLYFSEIDRLKEKYKSSIEIYTGIELDYHKGREELFLAPLLDNTSGDQSTGKTLSPDYTLGSVHSLPLTTPVEYDGQVVEYMAVDGALDEFELLIKNQYQSDVDLLIHDYYKTQCDMIKLGGFNILGHIDLIKKHNRGDRFFSEASSLYKKSIIQSLDILARSDILLEVNTGGMARGKTDTPYPSPEYLFEAYKRNIPVMVNSDSHDPSTLDFYFKESEKLLLDTGYREIATLRNGKWIKIKISR